MQRAASQLLHNSDSQSPYFGQSHDTDHLLLEKLKRLTVKLQDQNKEIKEENTLLKAMVQQVQHPHIVQLLTENAALKCISKVKSSPPKATVYERILSSNARPDKVMHNTINVSQHLR
jgi:hypothetical protein